MDLHLTNATPLAAALLPMSPDRTVWSLIVKATYSVRADGTLARDTKASLIAVDVPGPLTDDVGALARYESDFAPFKPRADCLCVGTAYPPGGAATSCLVAFGVAPHFEKEILVVGDRQMVRLDAEHVGATKPALFTSMPVTFAHAYGGQDATANDASAFFSHNPYGKGYAVSGESAVGRRLPNLEDPARRLRGWHDRVEPRAFGPVGRTWQPRLARAGTFDDRWLLTRAPQLPHDFSESYYNAAPEDQQVPGYLRGDEEVRLTNLHPSFAHISFRLPGIRLRAIVATTPSEQDASAFSLREATINLDTLWMDADALKLVLVWRARLALRPGEARVLLVREHVDDELVSPEIYRPVLERRDAQAADARRREAELDREDVDDEDQDDDDVDDMPEFV
jgi:hypothetical protein